MAYLAPAFLIIIAYLIGSLTQTVFRAKVGNIPETILIGTMVMLLGFEAVIMPSIKLLASFDIVCKVYSGILLGLVILAIIFAKKNIQAQLKINLLHDIWPVIGALGIFVLQIVFVLFMAPDLSNDYTVEMVNTTLVSDLIYENHPGMGPAFQYGITFRGKLVTLPLFYAYLVKVFGGSSITMVFRVMPIWMLVLNSLSYWLWGFYISGEDKHNWNRGQIFMMGIGLLNIFGSFAQNCVFYYQMHKGFSGETMIYGCLLPFCVFLCSRVFAIKSKMEILYLGMVLATTICVTDYQKGLVPIAVSIIMCAFLMLVYRLRRWIRCH